MDVQLSRSFRDLLNSLPPRERFKMQTDFSLSKDPVKYARSALLRRAGGVENA